MYTYIYYWLCAFQVYFLVYRKRNIHSFQALRHILRYQLACFIVTVIPSVLFCLFKYALLRQLKLRHLWLIYSIAYNLGYLAWLTFTPRTLFFKCLSYEFFKFTACAYNANRFNNNKLKIMHSSISYLIWTQPIIYNYLNVLIITSF